MRTEKLSIDIDRRALESDHIGSVLRCTGGDYWGVFVFTILH